MYDRISDDDREDASGGFVSWGVPVDKVGLWSREGEVERSSPVGHDPVHALKNTNVCAVRRGGNSQPKIINIR